MKTSSESDKMVQTAKVLRITPLEKALYYVLLPLLAFRTLLTFFFLVLLDSSPLHWRQKLALALLQAQRKALPRRILRWTTNRTTTGQAVEGYCVSHRIAHETVRLDASSTGGAAARTSTKALNIPPPILHLLNPADSDWYPPAPNGPVLVYFHGGGYVNPLRAPGHMPLIRRCGAACGARRIIILEYSLAPEHPYPAQLVQCIETVRYVLHTLSVPPGDIILAGDSAGGQLVGGVLAHLVRPCPFALPLELPTTATSSISSKFRAAVMISPFVRFPPPSPEVEGPDGGVPGSASASSYELNASRDYLTREQVDRFMEDFGAEGTEIYANLSAQAAAAEPVWAGVFGPERRLVEKVLVTVGTAEVFLDCCRFFADNCVKADVWRIEKGSMIDEKLFEGKDYMLIECEGEVHVQPALDCAVMYEGGLMMKGIMGWMTAHCATV